VEQRERISLRASWSSSGVASGKFGRSGCACGWEETGTPSSSYFTFFGYDKYFHTLVSTKKSPLDCGRGKPDTHQSLCHRLVIKGSNGRSLRKISS
jgi:hypothetical protein